MGIALFRNGDSPTSLIERADQCLYMAKHAGRNRVITEMSEAPRAQALAS
jgi:diguanylate cyclase